METAKTSEFTFRGNGGLRIACWRWLQDDPTAPVVVFAHGYTSFALAYEDFLDYLFAQGFSVYAMDHRGHGSSEGVRASLDRFDDLIDDFQRLVQYAKAEHPGAKIVSCGHSMGGLLVFRHAFLVPDDLDGVISMSPALVVGIEISDLKRKILIKASHYFPELALIPFEAPPEVNDNPLEPEPQANLYIYTGKTRLESRARNGLGRTGCPRTGRRDQDSDSAPAWGGRPCHPRVRFDGRLPPDLEPRQDHRNLARSTPRIALRNAMGRYRRSGHRLDRRPGLMVRVDSLGSGDQRNPTIGKVDDQFAGVR